MTRKVFFFVSLLLACALLFSCARSAPAPAKEALAPAAEPLPLLPSSETLPPQGNVYLGSEAFRKAIEALKLEFTDHSYWNHDEGGDPLGTTAVPCDHTQSGIARCNRYESVSTRALGTGYGMQCAGFAGLLSDRVFGTDAPARLFEDYDALRPGDQARIENDTHSVFILEKTDDYCIVAECNAAMNNCRIDWGRKIPRDEMQGVYITRDVVL